MNKKMPTDEQGYLLDSDVVSLFVHHQGRQLHIERRILATPAERLWISVITVEEALSGAFRLINNPKSPDASMAGCTFLRRIMAAYSAFQIFPYTTAAAEIYKKMPASAKRTGRNDCKIAAIALTNNFVVITRNVRDFQEIPDVAYEDWSGLEIKRR